MKNATLLVYLIELLLIACCCSYCCCPADADTSSCMVICEVPEEPVSFEIPKVEGKGYFYIEEEQIIYTTVYGG